MERRTLLPRYAYVPASLYQFIYREIVLFTIILAVQEQHICAFGFRYLYALKFVLYQIM